MDNVDNFRLTSELAKKRIVLLSGDFDFKLASDIVSLLLIMDFEDSEKEITIYINSDGGDVDCLLAIYDTIQIIKSPVKTVCIGCAYSAGAMILAAGTPGLRFASENSNIMIHQIQLGGAGASSGSDFEIEAKAIKSLKENLSILLARHTGQYLSKIKRDCERDKYMNAQQAKEYGIIDNIIKSTKEIPPLKKKIKKS